MFPPSTHTLVVDDFMSIRQVVVKSCMELGLTKITEAEDINVAWEKLTNANPPIDLILSDWNMPGGTGIDLLKRVRGDARFKTLPLILITTENEKARIVEAITAGASNYIVKPFTTESLRAKLEAVYLKIAK